MLVTHIAIRWLKLGARIGALFMLAAGAIDYFLFDRDPPSDYVVDSLRLILATFLGAGVGAVVGGISGLVASRAGRR